MLRIFLIAAFTLSALTACSRQEAPKPAPAPPAAPAPAPTPTPGPAPTPAPKADEKK